MNENNRMSVTFFLIFLTGLILFSFFQIKNNKNLNLCDIKNFPEEYLRMKTFFDSDSISILETQFILKNNQSLKCSYKIASFRRYPNDYVLRQDFFVILDYIDGRAWREEKNEGFNNNETLKRF